MPEHDENAAEAVELHTSAKFVNHVELGADEPIGARGDERQAQAVSHEHQCDVKPSGPLSRENAQLHQSHSDQDAAECRPPHKGPKQHRLHVERFWSPLAGDLKVRAPAIDANHLFDTLRIGLELAAHALPRLRQRLVPFRDTVPGGRSRLDLRRGRAARSRNEPKPCAKATGGKRTSTPTTIRVNGDRLRKR